MRTKETLGEKLLSKPKQELFCQIYAGVTTKNLFGNATQSYLQSHGGQREIDELEKKIPTRNTDEETRVMTEAQKRITSIKNAARANAARLIANDSISARCGYLINRFLDPEIADREMAYVIAQREDLHAKVSAYTAVAKVKNRLNNKLQGEFIFKWEEDSE